MLRQDGISAVVINRLPRYYRVLTTLMEKQVERISSKEFARLIGLTASQIRQDLNCFGGFGQQGYGYNVRSLRAEIARILVLDTLKPTILIGTGNIGAALVSHTDFSAQGFQLMDIFDSNASLIGKQISGYVVRDAALLKEYCKQFSPKVAVLCVPTETAKEIVDLLVEQGITAFWNFTHFDIELKYSNKAVVQNVHLGDSLMALSYFAGTIVE